MPDQEQERLAADLGATVGLLMRHLRAVSQQGALTASQRSALARIDTEGPTTIAALARAELVRPQSMRLTIGALEEQGVVRRSPHPTDGRQVVFSPTEDGRRIIGEARQAKQNWLAVAIAERLDPAEQRTVAEATGLLRRLVRD
ncbi:MarR family transcriptional regulator [Streptomyces sp. CB02923]|uniref:MarR family winged helix-turn-helix transcriptional regulator n=1 Tax=Streptomyces sp. CB02923 TaxID=1718985 RepID=UPI00093BC07D|nr:MarR family transcriptional regulator [Streptomyces sp. CB02923]OKI00905.1 MarR family transcriptional regulator [Streptomyces sp. CB02923]